MAAVRIVESKLDIFQAPQTHALAHDVESSFMALRGSLAWQFGLIYGDVDELRQRSVSRGNCAVLEHNSRFIYYLVTKSNLYEASTYDDVQAALICMREHMVSTICRSGEWGVFFPEEATSDISLPKEQPHVDASETGLCLVSGFVNLQLIYLYFEIQ